MEYKEKKIIVNLIFSDIIEAIQTDISAEYIFSETENEESGNITLSGEDFVLVYLNSENIFYLSFKIGLPGWKVAELTKTFLTILDLDEFVITEDYYYDVNSKVLLFGAEAIEFATTEMLSQKGKVKCPFCNVIVPKDYIKESGFCIICDKNKDTINWN